MYGIEQKKVYVNTNRSGPMTKPYFFFLQPAYARYYDLIN